MRGWSGLSIGIRMYAVFGVLTAMLGTFRSSVWTIGYVTQVDA